MNSPGAFLSNELIDVMSHQSSGYRPVLKPKFDMEKLNPDYLQRIHQRLAKAREAGIYVSVMLFEGYGVQFLSDTDHLWGIGGDATWVWKTFTRGLNPIFMDTYDGKLLGKVRQQDDGPRRAMGQVLALSRQINLARSTPSKELSSTGYCLVEPGVSYVVFASEGGVFDVDLTATGGLLSVEWLHPINGRSLTAETVAGGARRRFTAPAGEPVVLLLRNVSRT
ncbi:MAG: hypothetical protein JW829_18925 [Pirellulales bacterium]|nr:hypothetical protein [Pirellulales bacterium]